MIVILFDACMMFNEHGCDVALPSGTALQSGPKRTPPPPGGPNPVYAFLLEDNSKKIFPYFSSLCNISMFFLECHSFWTFGDLLIPKNVEFVGQMEQLNLVIEKYGKKSEVSFVEIISHKNSKKSHKKPKPSNCAKSQTKACNKTQRKKLSLPCELCEGINAGKLQGKIHNCLYQFLPPCPTGWFQHSSIPWDPMVGDKILSP